MLGRLAPTERRGQAISAFFVAGYAGLIIPVVGVGMLSGLIGTFPAVLAFSLLLAALCLFSLARTVTALAPGRALIRPGVGRCLVRRRGLADLGWQRTPLPADHESRLHSR